MSHDTVHWEGYGWIWSICNKKSGWGDGSLWSFLFFYAHEIAAAFFEIIALLIVIIINAAVFYKIDKAAGLLFIPYILWVSFATVLTYNIFSLNPS